MKRDNYVGNKRIDGIFQKIMNHIPQHTHYYELFFGGGAIFKELSSLKNSKVFGMRGAINDLNPDCLKDISIPEGMTKLTVPAVRLMRNMMYNFNDSVIAEHIFIFLDPPYLHSTRPNSKELYGDYEMNDEDHRELLLTVRDLKCHVMITHPKCELYDSLLHEWSTVEVKVRYNNKTSIEVLYMNYDISELKLHTRKYLGKDSWDRLRIKRKANRLVAKLRNLPTNERIYLIEAIEKEFKHQNN